MHLNYNEIWFILLGVLLTGYAILDGLDFGVGILHLFTKTDEDRRLCLNSIGPIWDGNEVWLVTFGGALFAAFPNAYATAFSGFYIAFMLLLNALIFRAVSIEFRSKHESKGWRQGWDIAFTVASTSAPFIFGVLAGNSFIGLPLGADMMFNGSVSELFGPYPCLVGLFAVATCAMHGSIYLYLKTEGALQKQIHGWMWTTFGVFIVFYMFTTIVTLVQFPLATANFLKFPLAWLVVLLNVLAIANIPRAIFLNRPQYAFFSSICTIAALTFLFGAAMYPNLIVARDNPAFNIDVYNGASSNKTLGIMLIVAALGMPFVCCYTFIVYWVFRGKTQLNKHSY
ncbi:MAG: cytochrome d ubiquinol oxidase subunit II [Candidatus Obscuribacterales bacterium]|nr:cytochrome d ubiquinol oxidase subunit II [Candidatus Obscuribacterales bacterium]